MNPQISPDPLYDFFSTAELICFAGLLALLMGIAAMLTGRNSYAVAGIAAAVTGIVTMAVGMVWSVVDSFDVIIDFWTGNLRAAGDIPVIALFSSAVIVLPIAAVILTILLLASCAAVAVVSRRIHRNQPAEAMNGKPS